MSACWFANLPGESAGDCVGRLVRCHLIDQQQIRKAFPKGAIWHDGRWISRLESRFITDLPDKPLFRMPAELAQDPRSWRPGCGGLTGIGGHHGMFDQTAIRPLRVPRALIPVDVEEYAAELGLTTWLDRTYQ